MGENSTSRALAVSQKIFERLLLAYPKAHRAEYGPAMAQLFRDQCRDAWNESQNWGVMKLWLRVLPDLARTSIMERLAALNKRKTMSDKLGNLAVFGPSPGKIFTRTFVAVFLIVLAASIVTTNLLPEIYRGESRILVQNEHFDSRKSPQDYEFVRSELETIQSPEVLNPVIEQLKLNEVWGKKYFAGVPLKTSETFSILKARLAISPPSTEGAMYSRKPPNGPLLPVFDTKVFQIDCYSEDKIEAAQIANAVAESYRSFVKAKSVTLPESKFQPGPVSIIMQANPENIPVKPNKPLNITLGVFVGILLAGVIGGVAAFIALRFRKKTAVTA